MISFSIPGKPQGKQRPRFVRRTGHVYTPKETVSYETLIALAFQKRYPNFDLLTGALSLSIEAYMPIPTSWSQKRKDLVLSGDTFPVTRPDFDQIAKIVADALESVAYHNDSQIVDCRVTKLYDDRPRLEIKIDRI